MTAAVFFLFLATSIGLALAARRHARGKGVGEMLVAGRSLPTWLVYFLAVGEMYSVTSLLGFTGGIYAAGASYGIWFYGYILLAYPIGYFTAPLLWRAARRYQALTLVDLVRRHFSSRMLERLIALVMVAALLANGMNQVLGLRAVLTGLDVGLSPTGAAVLGCGMALLYVAAAGMRSSAYVAVLKDTCMVLGVLLMGIAVLAKAGGIQNIFDPSVLPATQITTGGDALRYVMTTIVLQSFCMYLGFQAQFLLPSRSEGAVKKSLVLMPLYMLMFPFLALVGFYGAAHRTVGTDPNGVFLVAARDLLPDWGVGVVAAAAGLAAMLVLAALALTSAGMIARNILPGVPERKQSTATRLLSAAFLLSAGLLSATSSSLMATVLALVFAIGAQAVPTMTSMLFARRMSPAALGVGIAAGSAVLVWFQYSPPDLAGVSPGLVALLVNYAVAWGTSRVLPAAPLTPVAARPEPEPDRRTGYAVATD
ncbi:sodium:solute symporter family protein [Streptomyces sp. LE64]|uniref:sodium:solute symporter family protein n=1 Tax=Streptomyces sp. LE64 TaxID=3448653 RepID=UPI004041221E